MSGTPLDLTPFGPVLAAIGWLYWLVVLAVLVVAWWLPKMLWQKIAAVAIGIAAIYFVFVRPVQMRVQEQRQQQQAAGARLEESMALFKKRCEMAEEKITRTVENVDGIVWMRWREKARNDSDQFKLDDPYGHDCGLEGCIYQLLRPTSGATSNPDAAKLHTNGYKFVETVDPRDGRSYRFVGAIKQVLGVPNDEAFARHVETTGHGSIGNGSYLALERTPIEGLSARYGVTWDDISTREDREHWIAGSSIKVIDLQTKEVVAERTGYLIDTGQGSTSGFRSPWGWAKSYAPRCPPKVESTLDFAARVLKRSKQGEQS